MSEMMQQAAQTIRSLVSGPAKANTTSNEPADEGAPPPTGAQNPVLALEEYEDRYGRLAADRFAWRAMAFAMGVVALIAVVGLLAVARSNHIVPYVVEVDKFGEPRPLRRADMAAPADTRIIRFMILRWLDEVRSVTVDAGIKNEQLQEAYAMVQRPSQAFGMLNEYFSEEKNDPFKRAAIESVTVQIQSVVPETPTSWRVDWVETLRDRQGTTTASRAWTGTVSFLIRAPTDERTVQVNPIGLYVKAVNWAPRS